MRLAIAASPPRPTASLQRHFLWLLLSVAGMFAAGIALSLWFSLQSNRETNSVLLAVASFWEGVDIPGESLSLVIIDKLPFEVPSDPVIMARMNRIKALGGNPFNEEQLPEAVLALKQGLGRLIRTRDDKGLLALLDVRVRRKSYGRTVLASLPPWPVLDDLEQARAWYRKRFGTPPPA